jgi:hypothetical protein
MLRQVRASRSHAKRGGLCRATAMSRIPSLKKCLDLVVPNAEILVSKVPISNRALSRIVFLTLSSLR